MFRVKHILFRKDEAKSLQAGQFVCIVNFERKSKSLSVRGMKVSYEEAFFYYGSLRVQLDKFGSKCQIFWGAKVYL